MKFLLSLIITLVFSYTVCIFPASFSNLISGGHKADIVKINAERLQQKIILSDSQTVKVKDILSEYLSKPAAPDNKNDTVIDKVAGLLDQRQKAKFDIIKNDWWNSFLKDVKKQSGK